MKRIFFCILFIYAFGISYGQNPVKQGDSLMNKGLLISAVEKYSTAFAQNPSPETSYKIASAYALLWTAQARDSAFSYLNHALKNDSTLKALYDPTYLSVIEDQRWKKIENSQLRKYEVTNGPIENKTFALELFRMIIKDQGFMYVGNIERKKHMQNGGHFGTPAIYPILAMEEKNMIENKEKLVKLLDINGWPTVSSVTEYAAAGAALIINHTTYEIRSKYFPMLEKAFKQGEAQPLRYAKMRDRLLVEEGKEQLFGTQWKFQNSKRVPHPIEEPEYVDKRRAKIGLGTLSVYLKERFDIEWNVDQKQ
jgi:hypothetical protein